MRRVSRRAPALSKLGEPVIVRMTKKRSETATENLKSCLRRNDSGGSGYPAYWVRQRRYPLFPASGRASAVARVVAWPSRPRPIGEDVYASVLRCLVAEFVIVVTSFSGGLVGIPGLRKAASVDPSHHTKTWTLSLDRTLEARMAEFSPLNREPPILRARLRRRRIRKPDGDVRRGNPD